MTLVTGITCLSVSLKDVSGGIFNRIYDGVEAETRPRGYKTFFMLNSAVHDFFLLINVKIPTIVGILIFMSSKSSIIGLSEPKKAAFLYIFIPLSI